MLIVDDDVATRVGLRAIMNAEPDIDVVGESGSAEDAYGLVRTVPPDVVLMDVQLPGADGITATERIASEPAQRRAAGHRAHDVRARRLRVSLPPRRRERIPAQAAPAPRISPTRCGRLRAATRSPAPVFTRRLIERFADSRRSGSAAVQTLTDREREVLVLIAAGRSNQEIAADLSISLDTVKSHVKHVFTKLDARDRRRP